MPLPELIEVTFELKCLKCGLLLPLILVVAEGVQEEITTRDVQLVLQSPGYTNFNRRPVPKQGILNPALGVCEKSIAGTGPHVFNAREARIIG